MSRPPLSFLFPRDDGVADAVLLARFAGHHDEAAFELLVRRYADVVWTVCRGTAGNHHAAEDAFQATFLTLAKRAAAVRENVAGWLHRVAYHAALKARSVPAPPLGADPPAADSPVDDDSAEVIHAELAALPDRYRLPLVLCDLEGLTHQEAARQLGWPVGSVSGRLVRARERLKTKLVRRGVAPAAVAVTTLPLNAASPLIRISTTAATGGTISPTVAALSHGVLSAMRIAKLKLTAAVAAGAIGLIGMATVIGVSAQSPGEAKDAPPKVVPRPVAAEQPRPNADGRQRAHSVNQLRDILTACHKYADANGHFPADVLDKDGKPLLSWRVLILPYLKEEALSKQFKHGEPWDSAHNKKLAETVVKAFTNGNEPKATKYAMTFFQRPTGAGLIHDLSRSADGKIPDGGSAAGEGGAPAGAPLGVAVGPRVGKIRLVDVTDGVSNTIFVVEAEKAVEWAKPDDLTFDVAKPVELHGPFANVFNCGMTDGSVRTVAGGLSAVAAMKLLSRDGGEIITDEEIAGGGWPHYRSDGTARAAADVLKEIETATAALKKALDETDKLRADVFKKQGARAKKFGNTGLATHLVELERMLVREKVKQRQLADELKGVQTVK